jgi:uncharacterized protein YegL
MPILTAATLNQDVHAPHTAFGFSAIRLADLDASEYTLAVVAADTSGSVGPFRERIERAIGEIVGACGRSPRADNLLMRVVRFDHDVQEIHSFMPLANLTPARYRGALRSGGTTALHDAALNAIGAVSAFGERLAGHDLAVNGIVFVITDGQDNASTAAVSDVRRALAEARVGERLEAITAVLIGVNVADASLRAGLQRLADDAGFDRFIALDDASAAALARLADFVSRSICAQSQALGAGTAAASLTF